MGALPRVIVGIVGYSAVVESYPLGPRLMAELETEFEGYENITVENFTWSPIHVIQRFQDGELDRPDRIVLVGLAAKSRTPGTVTAHCWRGGNQPEAKVQERVYEAVTGVVDLENTLMIGSYFNVWPDECLTVEVDLAPDTFGRLVIAENKGQAIDDKLKTELGFSPNDVRNRIVETVRVLALEGTSLQNPTLKDKTADMLVPVQSFAETHIASVPGG